MTPNKNILARTPEGLKLRNALTKAERDRLYAAHRENDWATLAEFTGADIGTN